MSTTSIAADETYSPHPDLDKANERVVTDEQSALGAMMLSQDARIQLPKILTRADFFSPRHAAVWDAIVALSDQGEPADPVTVAAELQQRGRLDAIGGAPYLHTLMNAVPTAVNAEYYAAQVREVAVRRTVAEQGQRVVHIADSTSEPSELEEHVTNALETCLAAAEGPGADKARPLGTDDTLFDELVAALGQRPSSAFTTGIKDLDKAMIAQHGALIVMSADTGVGKSFLGAQIARHYARDRGERVLFHSLEMSREEMAQRDLSAVSGVTLSALTGVHDLAPTDHDLIVNEYLPAYREWACRMHYVEGRVGVAEVRRTAQRIQHDHRGDGGIGLVVVDYLQIMQRPRDVSTERDDLALAAMTSALKDLAMELNCIVIAISQFSNEGAKANSPKTYHMKGSSSLGQDADVVAFLVDAGAHEEQRDGELDLQLPKVRKGISGASVTLADCRHQAHFGSIGNNSRAVMSPEERAAGGMPTWN